MVDGEKLLQGKRTNSQSWMPAGRNLVSAPTEVGLIHVRDKGVGWGGVRRSGTKTGGPRLPFFILCQAHSPGLRPQDSAGGGRLEERCRRQAFHFSGASNLRAE